MSNYPAGVPISHPFTDGATTRKAAEWQASVFKPMSDTVAALAGDRWWHPMKPGLLNGWVPFGYPWETPKWRRFGALVVLKGIVKSGTGTGSTSPMWTLPAGTAPSQPTRQLVYSDGAGAVVRVDPNGTMYVLNYIGGSNVSLSLDQVWWMIE